MSGPMYAGCCTCIVVVVVSVILILLGFSKLSVNEVGLDYSANSLTVNTDKLYSNGIYFIGVGHSFIKYPKRQLELNMERGRSIVSRSNDGLQVTISTKVLYSLQIDVDALASLYLMFKDDYETPVENICRSVIRDIASEYTAFQFWTNRSDIENAMQDALSIRLEDIFVKVETFLLSSYELPNAFKKAIEVTEVQRQEMNKVEFEVEKVEQQTQALVLKADEQVLQIETLTQGIIESIRLVAEAEIFKLNASIEQEIAGYKDIKSKLGLSTDQLTTMIWLDKMAQTTVPKTIVVNTPPNLKL